MFFPAMLVAFATTAAAAKDSRTFAVLHFYGGGPLTTGRADPIISPGQTSSHLHTIQGGNRFSTSATGETLKESTCTSSLIKNDLSAYWVPTLFFQSPENGSFIQVPLFYMNVYYFFEATNDDIKAFPTGLQMVSGNAMLRSAPVTTGELNLDPSKGTVQPTQWTCPRSSYDPPSYPAGSDGSTAGIQDPQNQGAGMGLPFQYCDGYASPLRLDVHFPSCYNPNSALDDYKTNMVFPSSTTGGKQDCPDGWIHTPHIFFEAYWNTPLFKDAYDDWDNGTPFVLADGDRTGFSGHADFLAAWDEPTLQQIIDNCNTGDSGMDQCPGLIGGTNLNSKTSCNIPNPSEENIDGWLDALPGTNPIVGWGVGDSTTVSMANSSSDSMASVSSKAAAAGTSIESASSNKQAIAESSTVKSEAPSSFVTPANAAAAAAAGTTASTTPSSTGNDSGDDAGAAPTTAAPCTISASGGGCSGQTETIWETVTEWTTVTMFDGQGGSSIITSAVTEVTERPQPTGSSAGNDTSVSDAAGFKYVGCFDDNDERVLAGEIRPNLGMISNTNCVTYCKSKGWAAAGTEYGGQCYCGNELASAKKLESSKCNTACEGDARQTCGGGWALSLFTADGKEPSGSNATETSNTSLGSSKRAAVDHLHRHKHKRRIA